MKLVGHGINTGKAATYNLLFGAPITSLNRCYKDKNFGLRESIILVECTSNIGFASNVKSARTWVWPRYLLIYGFN